VGKLLYVKVNTLNAKIAVVGAGPLTGPFDLDHVTAQAEEVFAGSPWRGDSGDPARSAPRPGETAAKQSKDKYVTAAAASAFLCTALVLQQHVGKCTCPTSVLREDTRD